MAGEVLRLRCAPLRISPGGSDAAKTAQVRSRPGPPCSNLTPNFSIDRATWPERSFDSAALQLRISPGSSDAAKTAQVRSRPGPPVFQRVAIEDFDLFHSMEEVLVQVLLSQ